MNLTTNTLSSGEKILRPGDVTQITRVGDNLVCEVKLGSGKKELLPIVYFTRPYDPPILKKVVIFYKLILLIK